MADYWPAEIHIGGRIPASIVPELCRVITESEISLEWSGSRFAPTSAADLVAACEEQEVGPLLCLYEDNARWGEMANLEMFLEKHGIAFDRFSEGRYEYDRERVSFRPGHEKLCLHIDAAGGPVFGPSVLHAIAEKLDTALAHFVDGNYDASLSNVRSARELVDEELPPVLPPLERFVIVGEPAVAAETSV